MIAATSFRVIYSPHILGCIQINDALSKTLNILSARESYATKRSSTP